MSLRLGYDTYSLRAYPWDALQHLKFASEQKLDAIQFSSLEPFGTLEPAYLAHVRQRAQQLGILMDIGVGCICELSSSWNPKDGSAVRVLQGGLQAGKQLGSKAMRCVMGGEKDRRGQVPLAQLMEATAATLKKVRQQALDAGIVIAIENHKDLQAWQTKQLIVECGRDFVGSNLDLGNPLTLMEHPMTTLEVLGPYTVTSHFRDSAVYETPEGAAVQWTALGDGNVDFKQIVARFLELCPHSAVHLEIITGRAPYQLPYLTDGWWNTFGGMPAQDFARFVALAKRGRPFTGHMVVEDVEGQKPAPQFREALAYQQLEDLKRSFRYAQDVLGLGPHPA